MLTCGIQSHATLAQNAILALAKVVNKLDLLSDGYVFAQELLKNLESIAGPIIDLASKPEMEFSDIHGPVLEIILALFSNRNFSIVYVGRFDSTS